MLTSPHRPILFAAAMLFCGFTSVHAQSAKKATPSKGNARVEINARASEIDPRVRSYPEINFLIETKDGKPADMQQAWFDPSVKPRGQMVIWLMGHNSELFKGLNAMGLHAMRVDYANKWFGTCCQETPVDPQCRGNLRLEAATGIDASDEVAIAKPDSMAERAYQFVKYLAKKKAPGNWGQFLNSDRSDLDWEKVIVAGSSHGSTTAARFAKHQKVGRVVCLCGPRDQHQVWQSMPSATPANRFFAFSHVLDDGWKDDHYCRSWEMLGLNEFGPIVDVDQTPPPYQNTRRLITNFDVNGDAKRAHSSVQPGKSAAKNADGGYMHSEVWQYLFTHPVDQVGEPVERDPGCDHEQR